MAMAGADFVLGGESMTGPIIGGGRDTENRTKVLGGQDPVVLKLATYFLEAVNMALFILPDAGAKRHDLNDSIGIDEDG